MPVKIQIRIAYRPPFWTWEHYSTLVEVVILFSSCLGWGSFKILNDVWWVRKKIGFESVVRGNAVLIRTDPLPVKLITVIHLTNSCVLAQKVVISYSVNCIKPLSYVHVVFVCDACMLMVDWGKGGDGLFWVWMFIYHVVHLVVLLFAQLTSGYVLCEYIHVTTS